MTEEQKRASGEHDRLRLEPDESCSPLTGLVSGLQLAVVVIALVVVHIVIVMRTAEPAIAV